MNERTTSACPDRKAWEAYQHDELSAAARRRSAEHAAGCPLCAAALAGAERATAGETEEDLRYVRRRLRASWLCQKRPRAVLRVAAILATALVLGGFVWYYTVA